MCLHLYRRKHIIKEKNMSGFISRFYSGHIKVPIHSISQHMEENEYERTAQEKRETLMGQLSKKQKKLFLNYIDAKGMVQEMSEEDSFILGFRLGAKFAQDAFQTDDGAFYDLCELEY